MAIRKPNLSVSEARRLAEIRSAASGVNLPENDPTHSDTADLPPLQPNARSKPSVAIQRQLNSRQFGSNLFAR
jgi:hypothetical protein